MNDWGFVGRWEAARELAMLAYVDVVRRLDKIKMIGAFRDLFPYLGNIWQDGVNAFTSFLCPVEFPDGAVFFSPELGRQAGITVRLCERSLTRVFGSVTLAMDKARKGA